MKIEDTWKSLSEEERPLSGEEIRAGLAAKPKGGDPVAKVNRRLAWKIFFTVLFLPFYILAFFYVGDWLTKTLFAIITLAHFMGLILFVKRYRRAKSLQVGLADSKTTLIQYIDNVKSTLRQEELGGLILYPIAAAGGFFLSLLQEMSLDVALADRRIMITLAILMVVMTPLAHWLARWMNRKTFGRYLQDLESRLAELERQD